MFGSGLSKVNLGAESYYISPIYKKDKVRKIDKLKNFKYSPKLRAIGLAKSQIRMKELFDNFDINNNNAISYNEGNMFYFSDYLYMGRYVDEYI